jgi:hypothetical protein
MSTSSNRSAGRWRPILPLALVAIALITLYANQSSRLDHGGASVFASAQNVAGKVATRAKLTKKKRSFWGNHRGEEVVNDDAARDGEFDGSLWRRMRRVFDRDDSSSSWEWDLFLAESRMIFVSVIVSVLCAFVPFIWYSIPGKGISAGHDGEEGGGEFDVADLAPVLLSSYTRILFILFDCPPFALNVYFSLYSRGLTFRVYSRRR